MPEVGQFIGNTVGEAAAFAAGIAVGPLLAPLLRELENETWSKFQTQPVDAQTVAQGVAEGKITKAAGSAEATLTGYSQSAFDNLVAIMQTAPSVAEALTLIRRGQMPFSEFPTVLARAGLETEWLAFYQALSATGLEPYQVPLSPPDIALGMVRNNIRSTDNAGQEIFPLGLSSAGSSIPQHPLPNISPESEAAASGYTLDRFTVLANNVGLPPGIIEGLRMLNRGIITEADFALLIEQSDTRIAWGPALLKLARMILTPHEYAELRLRGWINDTEMYAGTAMSGLTQADTDLLVDMIGRPPSLHAITTGLERGGVWDGTDKTAPEPYLKMLQESNIRPEWYSIEYANRYTYPGYFVLKPMVQSGAITVDEAATYLLFQGWEPNLAALTAESFAPKAAASTDTHVKSSATTLITATRKAYVGNSIDQTQATTALTAAGVTPQAQTQLFALWDAQKAVEFAATPTGPVIAPPGGG